MLVRFSPKVVVVQVSNKYEKNATIIKAEYRYVCIARTVCAKSIQKKCTNIFALFFV